MQDILYYYDKQTLHREILGEIQTGFNKSFVIDGTKDSCKVIVINYSGEEIKALTIVKHMASKTWWVVEHDKVTRYKNESGYIYTHELQLVGAIELFNARDLTDCGFNQKKYTIYELLDRLVTLSNFGYIKRNGTTSRIDISIAEYGLDLDKVVDYSNTYTNYTLLSAIREILNGYNCSVKLEFEEIIYTPNKYRVNRARIKIIPKTGFVGENGIWGESDFNEIRQITTLDKDSYGTTVVSNAENVVSTKAKTYPTLGSVRLSANDWKISVNGASTNAIIRLPSNAYKVNWVKMLFEVVLELKFYVNGSLSTNTYYINGGNYEEMFNYILSDFPVDSVYEPINYLLVTNKDSILLPFVKGVAQSTIFNIPNVKPEDNGSVSFVNPTDNPDFYQVNVTTSGYSGQIGVVNKEIYNSLDHKEKAICWERNSDILSGFGWLNDDDIGDSKIDSFSYTDMYHSDIDTTIRNNLVNEQQYFSASSLDGQIYLTIKRSTRNGGFRSFNTSWIVNYIPMSDIKIKLDNYGFGKDMQLYNQNGKLTDSVALSKLLLSHAKQIESNEVTKFRIDHVVYNANQNNDILSGLPKVGEIVNLPNPSDNTIIEKYVINNVSLDFQMAEVPYVNNKSYEDKIGYIIVGEYTMSKNVATKSLMVNPNTNIRDYGIPQDKNVVRKQLYRDFYELSYLEDSDSDSDYYLPLVKVLNTRNSYMEYQEHVAIIKVVYDNAIGGGSYGGETQPASTSWYYQLNTTTYMLKKSIYEVVDFKDNNIIGYGSQNVYSGFFIDRIISGLNDDVVVPISYVDDNGELEDIYIAFCNREQISSIYSNYMKENISSADIPNLKFPLSNAFCFIDSKVYEGESPLDYGAKDNSDFIISEIGYKKDALEVPFFEYSCQIDDSEDIIVGENVLDTNESDIAYIYAYALVDKDKYTELNFGEATMPAPTLDTINKTFSVNNGVYMSYTLDNTELQLFFRESINYNYQTNTITSGTSVSPSSLVENMLTNNKDLMVVRYKATASGIEKDLMFILKCNERLSEVSLSSAINIKINHYKII